MICKDFLTCTKKMGENSEISCKNYKNCIISADNRSQVKCIENNKTYILENIGRERVILYKMDGGVIKEDSMVPQNTVKCDYLYITQDNRIILTELKGGHVNHALDQIDGTINLFKDAFGNFGNIYGRIVVSSAAPNLSASPKYARLQMKLVRMHGNLKVKENTFIEKIEQLSNS